MNFFSLNVRGLRSPSKRNSIFSFVKRQKCDIIFLQETYSQETDERTWNSEWGEKIFYTHGTTHSRGACILIKPGTQFEIENVYSNQEGRIVLVNLIIKGQKLSLCNVYAPTQNENQTEFLKDLNQVLMCRANVNSLVVGGDWNVTLQKVDKHGKNTWKPTQYRNEILSIMEELDLLDIARELHPQKNIYTYESKQYSSKSRIDLHVKQEHRFL